MSASSPTITVCRSGPLHGEVVVPGAKNSVLKLMAASILADGTYELTNVPGIVDVPIMGQLLRAAGLAVSDTSEQGVVLIENNGDVIPEAPMELAEKLRASINLLGPMLGRCGEVKIAFPGGDDFGTRPIDMHLAGLEAMGATFDLVGNYLYGSTTGLHGADIEFKFPSVGATENIMTAAVLADGVTTISNAAREPEIIDLCHYLVSMGAKVDGIGSAVLTITGVPQASLRACSHETVPDRIQAATYIAACALAGGQLDLVNAKPAHMSMVLERFETMGLRFDRLPYGMRVTSAAHTMRSTDIATLPYPGIGTDYKPLLMATLAKSSGTGIVTENLYPGRFRYAEELNKLGANIKVDGHHAVVRGVDKLVGTEVVSHDIRAGAAMVVAGLAAEGSTVISGVHHIDRGYDDLVGRLRGVGADISRQPEV